MTEPTIIYDLTEMPDFASEAAEAEYWDTHQLAPGLATAATTQAAADLLPATRQRPAKSTPTSLRLGMDLERRLRVLAERKGTTYQTLLKEFVLERVYEEEKRLNII